MWQRNMSKATKTMTNLLRGLRKVSCFGKNNTAGDDNQDLTDSLWSQRKKKNNEMSELARYVLGRGDVVVHGWCLFRGRRMKKKEDLISNFRY